jgi:hypothetical protein
MSPRRGLSMQRRLEDFIDLPCPYCKGEGKPHEGEVLLYLRPDGEWGCFADGRLYRCERGLKGRVPKLRRLIEYARARGLRAFAALDPGDNSRDPILIFVAAITWEEDKMEWPQGFENRVAVYYFGLDDTHKSAVERFERFYREYYMKVDQELLAKALGDEGKGEDEQRMGKTLKELEVWSRNSLQGHESS